MTPRRVRLWLLLAGLALGTALGELAVRAVRYVRRTPAEQVRINHEGNRRVFSDEPDTAYLFGHQSGIRVTLPHATFVTNGDGLRETRDYRDLPSSVVFLGDSVVEGATVENDETLDAVFERRTGIASLNFGVGASNTIQEYHWLVAKYRPDYRATLIVIGFCLNDFDQNPYLRRFDPILGDWVVHAPPQPGSSQAPARATLTSSLREVIKRSALAVFIYDRFVEWETGKPWTAGRVSDRERVATEDALGRIASFARRVGAEPVLVVFPTRTQIGRQYRRGERMQDVVIGIAERHGIRSIDLHAPLEREMARRPEVPWFWDEFHFHRDGHAFIGGYLATELPRMFPRMLPAPSPATGS